MNYDLNNIFNYATSELSQDAIIRYCLEFYNTKDIILRQLSIDLLKKFDDDIDFDRIDSLKIYLQFNRIDLLVVIPSINKVIIIEDKVNSNEHDNQINRYKEDIEKLSNVENDLNINSDVNIVTVYFKTGFINDDDRYIEHMKLANVIFKREDFLQILQKYINYDFVIKSYYNYLKGIDLEEQEADYVQNDIYDREGNEISHWEWNIATSYVCQQKLMRDIFNNNIYKYNFETGLYYLWSGSSFGRPFTEFDIYSYDNTQDRNKISYCLFWRIDTDTNGPYLSLRMYYKYKNDIEKEQKIAIYDKLREESERLISNIKILDFDWENVRKYKNGNGKDYEATVVHFNLKNLLLKWNDRTMSNEFIDRIPEFNSGIEKFAKNLKF